MLTKKQLTKEEKFPLETQVKQETWESLPGTRPAQQEKKSTKTRVIIQYDVGFGNQLFIRGKGAGLNWDKGILLKNTKADEWVWESTLPFSACEFKILLNDTNYEEGPNHSLAYGSILHYSPKF